MKQTPQEFVGKVLSSRGKYPPIAGPCSRRKTFVPISARRSADCIPAIPAPTTSADPLSPLVFLAP